MSEYWDFYMCRVDERPASIFLDLGLAQAPPCAEFPWMAHVRVPLREPRHDGLSSNEEYDMLMRIEDHIVPALEANGAALYVGRCTANGCRDFYFYASDGANWSERAHAAMAAFPGYSCASGSRHDPDWDTYRNFLHPSEVDIQRMQDRRVLEQLESNGDALTAAREIQHWAYFPTEAARQAFEAKALGLGFKVVDRMRQESADNSFGIVLAREDVPAHASIHEVTLPLFRGARECGGEYDGWETQVVA